MKATSGLDHQTQIIRYCIPSYTFNKSRLSIYTCAIFRYTCILEKLGKYSVVKFVRAINMLKSDTFMYFLLLLLFSNTKINLISRSRSVYQPFFDQINYLEINYRTKSRFARVNCDQISNQLFSCIPSENSISSF